MEAAKVIITLKSRILEVEEYILFFLWQSNKTTLLWGGTTIGPCLLVTSGVPIKIAVSKQLHFKNLTERSNRKKETICLNTINFDN